MARRCHEPLAVRVFMGVFPAAGFSPCVRPAVGAFIFLPEVRPGVPRRRGQAQMRWLYRIANSSAWSKSTAPAEMSFLTVAAVP